MGLFRKYSGSTTLSAPVSGELIPLSAVADKAFRNGLMGPGVAIVPDDDLVCSPCDGVLMMVAATGHAFGVSSGDGVEVLVHIGFNTSELHGVGLAPLVTAGRRIRAGQPIIRLDRAVLAERGADLTTPMVVTNAARFALSPHRTGGRVSVGDPVLAVRPNN